MRILGIDHGEVRIGLAISDETGTVARPLQIVLHTRREADAETVARIADEQGVRLIVVGLPTDADGEIGPQAHKVRRWADALGRATPIPIEFWDESLSSKQAEAARSRGKRGEPIDAHAAAIILQSFLDAQHPAAADDDLPASET
jgi:putative Holliday junction resolvase